ncbi:MAG: hypothetical protein STSR0007_03210 [Thermovirga sp.]
MPDLMQRIGRNLFRQGNIPGLPVNCFALIGKDEAPLPLRDKAAGFKIGRELHFEGVTLSP